jgi:beta-galactosidase
MIHGGTSFGFRAGADFRKGYMPDTTSYDYDSPLDEAGRPTPKFKAMSDVIRRYLPPGTVVPDPPVSPELIEIPTVELREAAPLDTVIGKPVRSAKPLTMEELGQPHGIVLYRHKTAQASNGPVEIDRVGDYAIVSVDGRHAGTFDHRLDPKPLPLSLKSGSTLEVLVDAMGHINFGRRMQDDRKGLSEVRLAGGAVEGWEMFGIPLNAPPVSGFGPAAPSGPAFYRGRFNLAAVGDTYLDMTGWGKGYVWVNGHNLGRYWSVGPQQALFVPAGWLRAGANEIVVLDLEAGRQRTIRGVRHPVWHTAEAQR